MSALYSGHVYIWNWQTQALVKSIEVLGASKASSHAKIADAYSLRFAFDGQVSELPVRAAKFVARKQWVVTGSDDMDIRCFSYNTTERLASFPAHSDYIRGIDVHPNLVQSLLLLSSPHCVLLLLSAWCFCCQ